MGEVFANKSLNFTSQTESNIACMPVYVMSIISSTSAVPAPRPPPDLPPLPGGLLLGSRPPQPGALLPAGRPPHRPGRRGPAARTLRIRGRSRKYFLALKYFCGNFIIVFFFRVFRRGDFRYTKIFLC